MFLNLRKAHYRKKALRNRARLAVDPIEIATKMLQNFPEGARPKIGQTLAGYSPIRKEMDPKSLMSSFVADGVRLALPIVTSPSTPLQFRSWLPGQALYPGAFKVLEPGLEGELLTPDVILVPLLAFDIKGHRLGYGKGYYDRTIATIRACRSLCTIGLGYEMQKIHKVPFDRYDMKLDWIVTEERHYKI